ncbi:hypothetical protein [Serratia marcescens]|uniref:hypothetical protein n=1 Tax=Serratia marcescens TaxID=615 RepID=UPI0002B88D6A|nr:hypothetical protein [Serratia marcescens]EMF07051.1 hypothetical protein F518_04283 [Serratia marcescens VGH107]
MTKPTRILTPKERELVKAVYGETVCSYNIKIQQGFRTFIVLNGTPAYTMENVIKFHNDYYLCEYAKFDRGREPLHSEYVECSIEKKYDKCDICRFKDTQYTFIHEVAHVWQHQNKVYVSVPVKGAFAGFVGEIRREGDARYRYELTDKKASLVHYGIEQQASIVADYFYFRRYGYSAFVKRCNRIEEGKKGNLYCKNLDKYDEPSLRAAYEKVLSAKGLPIGPWPKECTI